MSISQFRNRLYLIKQFIEKMNREAVPPKLQRIIVKIYAADLRINLTNKMIEDIM